MTDSRLKSLSESLTNIIPGFLINYGANFAILPVYAERLARADPIAMFELGVWFTGISIIRSYLLRRAFERFGENENLYSLLKRAVKR